MTRIIATKRDEEDRIIAYQTEDVKVLDHNQCLAGIKSGEIEGLQTFTNRAGEESIKSKRGEDNYSLKDLPQL